tara:strand:- start:4297 stop:4665 length:369 start_codon:yes stop_codon:yes gene_type:complete
MPATHSFALTPKASKMVKFHKYPRYLGGASKMVSDAIEFYWTEHVFVTGPTMPTDTYPQDPIDLSCVACGAKYPRREIRVIGDMQANTMALQEHLTKALEEIEVLKNRKLREVIWNRLSGSE